MKYWLNLTFFSPYRAEVLSSQQEKIVQELMAGSWELCDLITAEVLNLPCKYSLLNWVTDD